MENELNLLLEKANKIYWENFDGETYFERAIFLSWYCSVGDCKFCYMSTQKNSVKEPLMAKRQTYSLLAEAIICKKMNWPIGFLSGGYGVYNKEKLLSIVKTVYEVTNQKQWMNIGVLNKSMIEMLLPYIDGVTGSVETVNLELHKEVCPSKPIKPIIEMYKSATELKIKKSMTLIIGLGETKDDFEKFEKFIIEHGIDKVVIYALNPIKGTVFKKGPEPDYYLWWLAKTRIAFPKLYIVAGVWVNRLTYLEEILKCGANSITKLPIWKVIDTKNAEIIKDSMKKMNRNFKSKLNFFETNFDEELKFLDDKEKEIVLKNINLYLNKKKILE
jgi:biotin synthase-like enzyme